MNNKQINIAIALACGWKWHDHPDCMAKKQGWSMPEKWIMRSDETLGFRHNIPDYCNDLNAMHEAEKVLNKLERDQYWDHVKDMTCEGFDQLHSNSRQRAEAFLRTIDKWKEARFECR